MAGHDVPGHDIGNRSVTLAQGTGLPPGPGAAPTAGLWRRGGRNWEEFVIPKALLLTGVISVLTTIGIIVSLLTEAVAFFQEVSLADFLLDIDWTPRFVPQSFGIWPLVTGTLLVAAIAAAFALPVGLLTAIFLAEYAPDRLRRTLKPILEVLAGVPTVVFGFFALTFVTPEIVRHVWPAANIFNALSAGLVVGVMIIPMVASISEDAMISVPRSLRDGAYALGANRFEVATRVIVPAALSGIVASFVLAISRAIGETMIVTLAAGATPVLTANPVDSVQTMTAYMVQTSLGEAPHGTIEFKTLFAVGLVLFVMTLGMNILGHWIVRRFREAY